MKKSNRIVSVLLALAMVLTLCACESASSTSADAQQSTAQAAPETSAADAPAAPAADENGEKVIRIGLDGEPTNLSPFAGGSFGGTFFLWSCYSTLWSFGMDGEIRYELADGYSYDEDAKELTVNIRKDAKFSNGDPVTADDVIFSFQQNCAISGNRTPSVDFDNAYAPDENTVVLPVEPYNDTVIDGLCALGVCSKSWTEDFTNEDHIYVDILESGPYCLQDGWKSGDVMVFEKNPYYWDVDGLVYDRIEVSCIAEENTRYLSFTTDELDVCYLTDSGNVDTIAADSNYQLVQYPYQSITCLMFDTEYTDMFPNEEIRLAICYAVDVETIVETLCGSAYVPATSMLSSSNWAYKDETYGYDPELAKKYYEESGLKDFTFTLQLQDATMDSNIAEAIQGYLDEIGITMNIETYDTPTFFQHLMNQELFCMFSQYSGITDPGTLLNQWISTSPSVAAHTPPEIQAMLDEAVNSNASREERTQMFYDLQDAVKASGKILPLYEKTVNFAEKPGFDVSDSIRADGYLVANYLK